MWRNALLAIAIGFALLGLRAIDPDLWGLHWDWLLYIVTGVVTLPWALWRMRRSR
jgi:hypothetical protein